MQAQVNASQSSIGLDTDKTINFDVSGVENSMNVTNPLVELVNTPSMKSQIVESLGLEKKGVENLFSQRK